MDPTVLPTDPSQPFASISSLLLQCAPPRFFRKLQRQADRPLRHHAVFTPLVVIWLMLFQRLHDHGTMWAAVQQVIRGLPPGLLPQRLQRRARKLSSHTGAYNQARQKLPLPVVEQVSDRVCQQLLAACPADAPGLDRPVFLLDGSSLLTPHTPALAAAYPPGSNQHGPSHWPVIRVLVAHHLTSGLALRPQWGPMYGPQAVSEQALLAGLLHRFPSHSVGLADRNFGVFSVAWEFQQQQHDMLVRLTLPRARRAFGQRLDSGTDRPVDWRPSPSELRTHPHLPADACVHGRLIVRRVYPSDGSRSFKLYLFATLDLPVEEMIELYGKRWYIETDLRSLKQTVRLHMLTAQSPSMVAKELILGVCAYNLVRALMHTAAQQTGVDPRRLSFSRTRDVLMAWLPYLGTLSSPDAYQAEFQRMLRSLTQCGLYPRTSTRSYPRAAWGQPRVFPTHKTGPAKKPRARQPRRNKAKKTMRH
jgi:hypothetical protein